MAHIRLEIQDDYINEMAEYFDKQGKQLQDIADSYIAILRRITNEGIFQGETSDALKTFLVYAEKLKQVISTTSEETKDSVMNYLEEVDIQDHYLY